MLWKQITIFAIFFTFVSILNSNEKNLGIGIVLFNPTGISFKYRWDEKISYEAAFGLSSSNNGHFHTGFLYNFYKINQNMNLYSGISILIEERTEKNKLFKGFFIKRKDYYGGVRFPFGILFDTDNKDLDLFGELNLNFLMIHRWEADLNIALGIRIFI